MDRFYIILGIVAWGVALFFGLFMQTVTIEQKVPQLGFNQTDSTLSAVAPNPVSGPIGGGFAIAGGLCFAAACYASRSTADPALDSRIAKRRVEQSKRDVEASIAALQGQTSDMEVGNINQLPDNDEDELRS